MQEWPRLPRTALRMILRRLPLVVLLCQMALCNQLLWLALDFLDCLTAGLQRHQRWQGVIAD